MRCEAYFLRRLPATSSGQRSSRGLHRPPSDAPRRLPVAAAAGAAAEPCRCTAARRACLASGPPSQASPAEAWPGAAHPAHPTRRTTSRPPSPRHPPRHPPCHPPHHPLRHPPRHPPRGGRKGRRRRQRRRRGGVRGSGRRSACAESSRATSEASTGSQARWWRCSRRPFVRPLGCLSAVSRLYLGGRCTPTAAATSTTTTATRRRMSRRATSGPSVRRAQPRRRRQGTHRARLAQLHSGRGEACCPLRTPLPLRAGGEQLQDPRRREQEAARRQGGAVARSAGGRAAETLRAALARAV